MKELTAAGRARGPDLRILAEPETWESAIPRSELRRATESAGIWKGEFVTVGGRIFIASLNLSLAERIARNAVGIDDAAEADPEPSFLSELWAWIVETVRNWRKPEKPWYL